MKTRREFLKSIGVTTVGLTFFSGFSVLNCSKNDRHLPNIVIIFTDDQGYADVGCYGAKDFKTPNLDQLASEGMRFTNFYVSQAVCSASRASLLTGCYSERVGISGALMPFNSHGLNPEEDTIADVLKKKGYATGIFGKWHLGHLKEFLPLQQGFDEYLGLPYSNDMWPVDYDGKPLSKVMKGYYPVLPLIDGNDKVAEINTLDDQATLTTRYTKRAVKFINKNKNKQFFLYLPHSMPHVPLGVSDKFKGKSKQGLYGDVIMEIDWSVGEVMKALKDNSIDENTLIIFASDNGPWLNYGNHAGSANPLREGKGAMWEGGARVPCIMRWPHNIAAGVECHNIAASIDILPTLAAITNAPLPTKKIDGVNILSLLKGKEDVNPRDQYLYYYGGELRAVRQGDWKLYFPHEYRSYEGVKPGKDGHPGSYNTKKAGLELYNLENDISETKDLIKQYPEIVLRLKKIADKAREDLGDHLTAVKGKEVRSVGTRSSLKQRKVKHLALGAEISMTNHYHPKYSAGGENALVNGVRGTTDFHDGCWQGFETHDLNAVIDLGQIKSVKSITCGFLENHIAWIFFPSEVEFKVSTDGTTYNSVKKIRNKDLKFEFYPTVKDYEANFSPVNIRYIQIIAKNVGIVPEWHKGAGGKAWIFMDEIVVK